jgi:hypothetical protein
MLESENVQERLLGAGQQVYIGAPERIEPLAHEIATLGVTGRAGLACQTRTASGRSTATSSMNSTCLTLNFV